MRERSRLLNRLAWLLGGSLPRRLDDIRDLLQRGGRMSPGLASSPEVAMMLNVISLGQVAVEHVMVPYGKIEWLRDDHSYDEVLKTVTAHHHSRYPVMDAEEETVKGILHVKHLLGIQAAPADRILTEEILQPARTVPESKKLDSMLREFRHYRCHMMVVADDAGRPAGMVFIEDVLEHIVGRMHDEFDKHEGLWETFRQTSPGIWEVDGDTPLAKFGERFGLALDASRFDTVSGWASHRMGRLPEQGDSFEEDGVAIRVTKADERRVLAIEAIERGGRGGDGGGGS